MSAFDSPAARALSNPAAYLGLFTIALKIS